MSVKECKWVCISVQMMLDCLKQSNKSIGYSVWMSMNQCEWLCMSVNQCEELLMSVNKCEEMCMSLNERVKDCEGMKMD